MKDRLIRGLTKAGNFRFFAVDGTELCRVASNLHQLSPGEKHILGRLLCAAVMMGADLKNVKDLITINIDSVGPVKGAMATADCRGNVKGYLKSPMRENPDAIQYADYLPENLLGKGQLTVIRDMGLKHPHIGQIELAYGTIARDLTYYFAHSEQIPTSISLGVLLDEQGEIKKAGGFIIQVLPGTGNEEIELLEESLAKFPNFTDILDMEYDLEKIITDIIFHQFEVEIMDSMYCEFSCNCSQERFAQGLDLLERDEIEQAISVDESIEMNCHFCNKKYQYDPLYLTKYLLNQKDKSKNEAGKIQ